MAISKEVTKESGLITKYHRILKIAINYNKNQSIITLEDYISEDYREKAKLADEVRRQIKDLYLELDIADNDEIVLALTNKIQEAQFANAELLNTDYSISRREISLDYIPEDITFRGFYDELTKLEEFKDSIEI